MKIEILVAGTGRSGTVYMARLLSALGIMCGHESVFDFRGLDHAKHILSDGQPTTSAVSRGDWFDPATARAESSYMVAPFIQEVPEAKIIHTVRNPLAVISSHILDVGMFSTTPPRGQKPYLDFLRSVTPEEMWKLETEIERTCFYYTYWNRLIQKQCEGRNHLLHHVEDKCNKKLVDFLGISVEAYPSLSDKINSWSRRTEDLKFSDIPEGDVKKDFMQITNEYGYIRKMFL